MPSVELVLPSLEMGGMERVVSHLALGLRARGWEVGVTATSFEGELAPALRAQGVTVSVVPLAGWQAWFGFGRLQHHFRQRKPDLVHSQSGVWLRTMQAASRAGIGARMHTVHGLLAKEPWFGAWEKRCAAWLTPVVVGVSAPLGEYLSGTCGIAQRRLHVIPNGVDTDTFRPRPRGELRQSLQLDPAAYLVGTVARLDPVKNLEVVFQSLAQLAARGMEAHYVIAGDGPQRAFLDDAARAAGVADRVHLLGTVPRSEHLYPEFDAFVLPSSMEGTSLSLLEAMACGVPCVATAVGGNPRVLADGKAGLLIPPGDPQAIADALHRLAHTPALREGLAEAGRSRVVEHYSLTAMVDAYERHYLALIGAAA